MTYNKKERKRYHLKKNNVRGLPRMIIHKTEKHLYAQVINLKGDVIASISSLSEKIKGYNCEGANRLGELFREKLSKIGTEYVYDICGHRYYGRISKFVEALGFNKKEESEKKKLVKQLPINKKKSTEKKSEEKKTEEKVKTTKKKGE